MLARITRREKILLGTWFLLLFLAFAWFGYSAMDTWFYRYSKGALIVRAQSQPETVVELTECRTYKDPLGREGLFITDEQQNGADIQNIWDSNVHIVPLIQGQEIVSSGQDCRVTHSSLERSEFAWGSHYVIGQSWKGSIKANCDISNVHFDLAADIHACQ